MAIKKDISAHCVVRDSSPAEPKAGPQDCEIVDSVWRLMSLGLSAGEIRELGMAEGALEALCEYARLDGLDREKPGEVVGAALGTLVAETRKVDLELEMLSLRKRALRKRAKLLHKLADMLRERGNV